MLYILLIIIIFRISYLAQYPKFPIIGGIIFFIYSYNIAQGQILKKVDETDIFEKSLLLAEQGRWNEALANAKFIKNSTTHDIILWLKYKAGEANSFEEVQNFIVRKPYWPLLKQIKITAESVLDNNTPPNAVIRWFKQYPPETPNGMQMLIAAKMHSLSNQEAITLDQETGKLIKKVWVVGNFNSEDEKQFLNKYSYWLNYHDHIARINELLWKNEFNQAEKIIKKLPPDYQKLYLIRIKLLKSNNIPHESILNLPLKLRSDPHLVYDMARCHHRAEEVTKVVNLLALHPSSSLNKKKWWELRSRYIRELLNIKDYENAYKIAKNHHKGPECYEVDAEWLAGWISLRFLNKTEQAIDHFKKFYNNVKFPISLSRGAYWLAVAYDNLNEKLLAKQWYQEAAKYPYTYYGQLSMFKLGYKKISLPKEIISNTSDHITKENNELLAIAKLFFKLQRIEMAKLFVEAAIKNAKYDREVKLIVEFINKNQNLYLTVETAKLANREKLLFMKLAYPTLTKLNNVELEKPMIFSIIRQESVFNKYAKSSAGAMGMMQLMPTTAQKVAKDLQVKYSKVSLTADHLYNIKLGSNHLYSLVKDYNGSYILAIAAYNAGSANVNKWLGVIGDPRKMNQLDDIIDWIELVPFYETRNYLQRIIENLQIYRIIIDGKELSTHLNIDKDLMRSY